MFGSHLKKQKDEEVQLLYSCGNYIKLLSMKKMTSVIVYKNLKEITTLCIINQNKNILAFGTVSGAIKDYDMKNKHIVRNYAQRHKKAISCLTSHGKYLVSCSSADNLIIVYDYGSQEEFREVTLAAANEEKKKKKLQGNGVLSGDLPIVVCLFKDASLGHELLLIGSKLGQVYLYDLQKTKFSYQINKPLSEGKKGLLGKSRLSFESESRVVQIKKLQQTDKEGNGQDIFAAVSASGSVKLFKVDVNFGGGE